MNNLVIQPLTDYARTCECGFIRCSPYASVRITWYKCPKCGKDTSMHEVQDCIVIETELTKFVDFLADEDNEILEKMLEKYTEHCIRIEGESP